VASDESEFLAELERQGGWWAAEPVFEQWEQTFHTTSGKFEFYSQAIADRLSRLFPDAATRPEQLRGVGGTASLDEFVPASFGNQLILRVMKPSILSSSTRTAASTTPREVCVTCLS